MMIDNSAVEPGVNMARLEFLQIRAAHAYHKLTVVHIFQGVQGFGNPSRNLKYGWRWSMGCFPIPLCNATMFTYVYFSYACQSV